MPKGRVIQLKNDYESVVILKEMIEKLREDKINSFVIIAYEPHDKETAEKEKNLGNIHRYWFSQGGIGGLHVLGMLEHMKDIINRFMIDGIDVVRGGGNTS